MVAITTTMAYNTVYNGRSTSEENLINQLLKKIQASSQETCLWEKPDPPDPDIESSKETCYWETPLRQNIYLGEKPIHEKGIDEQDTCLSEKPLLSNIVENDSSKETCFWNTALHSKIVEQDSSLETCFWNTSTHSQVDKQENTKETFPSEKTLHSKVAEKRAEFILSMHIVKDTGNIVSVPSSCELDQHQKEEQTSKDNNNSKQKEDTVALVDEDHSMKEMNNLVNDSCSIEKEEITIPIDHNCSKETKEIVTLKDDNSSTKHCSFNEHQQKEKTRLVDHTSIQPQCTIEKVLINNSCSKRQYAIVEHEQNKEIILDENSTKQQTWVVDVNNNIITDENIPVVCRGPYGEMRKLRQPTLVRRRSSVDSGIIVRTPSEKYEDRERLVAIKSPATRCKTSGESQCSQKVLYRRTKSSSLPNLNEIDLNKFEPITFEDCVINKRNLKKQSAAVDSVDTSAIKRSKLKNLFNINNYIRGKYKKTKLLDLIKRNNTFSTGHKQTSSNRLRCKKELDSISDIEEDIDEISDEFVLTFDVNSIDRHGDTCLHYSSSNGDVDTIEYLLKNGGNVWQKNKKHQLPIDMSKDFRTAKLLSRATIFYTESETHKQDCNISSTVKLAFDL